MAGTDGIRSPNNMTRYQCCFCGQTIEPIMPDVGGLLYTTCIDASSDLHRDQQLYCHANCLRQRLHDSAKLYVLDIFEDGIVDKSSF